MYTLVQKKLLIKNYNNLPLLIKIEIFIIYFIIHFHIFLLYRAQIKKILLIFIKITYDPDSKLLSNLSYYF